MTVDEVENFYRQRSTSESSESLLAKAHECLLGHLESGALRAAQPSGHGSWQANAWVKEAILEGFRSSPVVALEEDPVAYDKAFFPRRSLALEDQIRLVPGGSAVRRGAYVAAGIVIMPPSYINVGAWVGERVMVDSHVLVGSCAQIGAGVHLSAGAQIGGVLEPAGALPVVVEDEAFVGGLVGLFEGARVGRRAVLGCGVRLTGSTSIYDLAEEREWVGEVPAGAVVVPGSRPVRGEWGGKKGLSVAAPIIVKYRDEKTDTATLLEEALR